MKKQKKDHNVTITNQILNMIAKTGILPWNKPWNMVDGLSALNFDSGRIYKGFFNQMILQFTAAGRLPLFGMFSNAHPAIKGERATYIWKPLIGKKEDATTGEKKSFCFGFKTIPVFHYTQLQGIDYAELEAKYAPESIETIEFNPIEEAERIINNMPNCPKISDNGGNSAFYRPSTDSIHMPNREHFHSAPDYYKVLFHELTHSTGHFTRLDRFKKTGQEFKSHTKDYSFEELVAELGACFVSSSINLQGSDDLENSAAYIQGWVKNLQSNPDWIVKASTYATQATNYILNKNDKKDTKDEEVTA